AKSAAKPPSSKYASAAAIARSRVIDKAPLFCKMRCRFGHKAGHLVLHLSVQLHADIGRYIAFPETPAGIFAQLRADGSADRMLGPSRVRVADVDGEEFEEAPRRLAHRQRQLAPALDLAAGSTPLGSNSCPNRPSERCGITAHAV